WSRLGSLLCFLSSLRGFLLVRTFSKVPLERRRRRISHCSRSSGRSRLVFCYQFREHAAAREHKGKRKDGEERDWSYRRPHFPCAERPFERGQKGQNSMPLSLKVYCTTSALKP